MKIHIVNYEQGRFDGILSKYARMMKDVLIKRGHKVTLGSTPSPKAEVNHHINYLPYDHKKSSKSINTLMVTHITTPAKWEAIKKGMDTADCGICFSEDTQKLLEGKGLKRLHTILPAHDSLQRRPRIVSILTNVYPDGCKREGMFLKLLEYIDRKKFVFFIMGKDWERILEPWLGTDFQGQLHREFEPNDYKRILDISDYCLYFGDDEGSMGILDAAQCGVKTIAPNTGFHQDIGIDYPFETQEELNQIFDKLGTNPVEDWTWDNYCRDHEKIWGDLLKEKSTKK